MFDGGARVPMIVRGPGRIPVGENPALFSHVDFLASLSQMAGHPVDAASAADSCELSAVLTGDDTVGRSSLVTEGIGAKTVVRAGDWVFIPSHEGPASMPQKDIETGNSLEPQLYNLSEDFGQCKNLASAKPEKVQELKRLLEAIHGKDSPAGHQS